MLGIDIIENQRLNDKPRLIKRFLSDAEFEIYQKLGQQRKIEFASGRWAAKEAFFKATNIKIHYQDIEIIANENGKPQIHLFKKLEKAYQISISHEKKYTVAIVIKTQ